jgi:hypothetical protein
VLKPECLTIQSKTFKNRKMKVYNIKLEKYDRIIFCSDGATQVAMGTKMFPLGLERKGLIKIILQKLEADKEIATMFVKDQFNGVNYSGIDTQKNLPANTKRFPHQAYPHQAYMRMSQQT